MVRVLTEEDYERLQHIMRAIYDDKPLAGDRRRDLANAMFAVLDRAVLVTEGDVPS